MMHKFKDFIVWQKARELVKEVYQLTSSLPDNEKFGLISQINRVSVSIPANIAEGSGRKPILIFVDFLISRMGVLLNWKPYSFYV
nr:four helix bundle protein [Labilibaculum filiforme]